MKFSNSFIYFSFLSTLALVIISTGCTKKEIVEGKIYQKPEIIKDPVVDFLSP